MDHGHLSMVANKFQWVFSEALLNTCGTDVKFCRRQRVITPFRLGLALTAACASQRVETLADLHCGFNALWGTFWTILGGSIAAGIGGAIGGAMTHDADRIVRVDGETTVPTHTVEEDAHYTRT